MTSSNFDNLPPEVIELIAIYVTNLHPFQAPISLLNLLLLNHRFHQILHPHQNPFLYTSLFRCRFDLRAIERRFSSSLSSNSHTTSNSSITNHLSETYRQRLRLFKRMRQYAQTSPPTSSDEDEEALTQDLWMIYMMVTENDGWNEPQLIKAGQVVQFLKAYHERVLSRLCFLDGYPPESAHISLGWKLYHRFVELRHQTSRSVESNVSLLKPFVFGCHMFEVAYAPWTWRQLPVWSTLTSQLSPDLSTTSTILDSPMSSSSSKRSETSTEIDSTFSSPPAPYPEEPRRSKSSPPNLHPSTLSYMGQHLSLLPPLISHVAAYSFFSYLNPTQADEEDGLGQKMREAQHHCYSKAYDTEIMRATRCVDPFRSLGLTLHPWRGAFEGTWEGQFAFLGFEAYREMLLSPQRTSLEEGRYGYQAQVFKLTESLVPVSQAAEQEEESEMAYLLRLAGPACKQDDVHGGEDVELQLHGVGHSAWGKCVLRGRVRRWDGMMTLLKKYDGLESQCWLYRGYLTPEGAMVGRWRDTFTPTHLNGYEGPFVMLPR